MFWKRRGETAGQEPSDGTDTQASAETGGDRSVAKKQEDRTQAQHERESRIAQEVQFQRRNSQISGNEPLSCLKSFDKLLGCYSVSNQIKSIYRFGNLDYDRCKLSFHDFRFCLNLKYNFDNSDPSNDQQSFHWNLRKAQNVFERPNSQDVWDARAVEPLEPSQLK
ncbi:uncharacterized protein VP01_87g10 [Puccinia sorghi]|uniref:Uncharacterized protein n=1 Tax=Puccinia sorghi TaxID=27349 RepID=A0A0L6U947_9BASI|nr:uncharacterized protein VP01_87g10 [Puccinia sorghi]